MKKVFHKILSVLMAFVVMFTTMSFTVDMHYCGDMLVDIAFFKEAKSCGMEQLPVETCGDSMQKESCCSDTHIAVEGQDTLKDTSFKLTFEQQTFVIAFSYSYLHTFEEVDTTITSFVEHPPPLLERNYQVLYETFLI